MIRQTVSDPPREPRPGAAPSTTKGRGLHNTGKQGNAARFLYYSPENPRQEGKDFSAPRHNSRHRDRDRNRYGKLCIVILLCINAGSAMMPASIPTAIAIPLPIPIPIVPFPGVVAWPGCGRRPRCVSIELRAGRQHDAQSRDRERAGRGTKRSGHGTAPLTRAAPFRSCMPGYFDLNLRIRKWRASPDPRRTRVPGSGTPGITAGGVLGLTTSGGVRGPIGGIVDIAHVSAAGR